MRVWYNDYYSNLPSWKQGFDSPHSHQFAYSEFASSDTVDTSLFLQQKTIYKKAQVVYNTYDYERFAGGLLCAVVCQSD